MRDDARSWPQKSFQPGTQLRVELCAQIHRHNIGAREVYGKHVALNHPSLILQPGPFEPFLRSCNELRRNLDPDRFDFIFFDGFHQDDAVAAAEIV